MVGRHSPFRYLRARISLMRRCIGRPTALRTIPVRILVRHIGYQALRHTCGTFSEVARYTAGVWLRSCYFLVNQFRMTALGGRVKPGSEQGLAHLLSQVESRLTRRLVTVLRAHDCELAEWRVLRLLADRHGRPMNEIKNFV